MGMLDIMTFKYHQLMEQGDPRVQGLWLMDGPFPTMAICLSYVYFFTVLGPRIMENRKPLEIRKLMIAYNFFMVLCSVIFVYYDLRYHWLNGASLTCDPVDYSNSPAAMITMYNSYFYFIMKFIEFFDTLFFLLRKKFTHITRLHLIHHGIMPFSVWWGMKFVPGGHATFFGFANSIVHIVMYIYFGLSAVGPSIHKYLWWKKYLTAFQLVQFIAIMAHSFQLFFRDCNFPKLFGAWIGLHGVLFWFLFTDFYKKTYIKPSVSSSAKSKASPNSSIASFASALFSTCKPSLHSQLHDSNKLSNGNGNGLATNGKVINGNSFLAKLAKKVD